MVKRLILTLTLLTSASNLLAAEQTLTQQNSVRTYLDNIHGNVELTTELNQDRKTRDVVGTNNFLEANLSYSFDRNNRINLANSWSGRFSKDRDSETNYDLVQLEYKRKTLNYNEDGLDVDLEGRISYTTNDEQRERYGTYGLAQFRAYWGLPLGNGFSINKYITYARMEKYIVREEGAKTRDFGWRMQLSPSYQIMRGLDFSLLTKYSGYKLTSGDVDQEVEVSPGFRYQYKKLALIVSAEFKPFDTDKAGDLAYVDGFTNSPLYSTVLTLYAF